MWASVAAKPKVEVVSGTGPAPIPTSLKAPEPPAASTAAPALISASTPAGPTALTAAAPCGPGDEQKLAQLVVDAGALIKGVRLDVLARSFYSVAPVMAEVRDKQARELMGMLPFEIVVRKPSAEALKAVSDFARRTGDFRELSAPDLQILALTYMLEVEANGLTYIREAPKKIVAARGGKGKAGQRPCAFFHSAAGCRNGEKCPFLHEGEGKVVSESERVDQAASAALQCKPCAAPEAPAAAPASASAGEVAALADAVSGASLGGEGEWVQPTVQSAESVVAEGAGIEGNEAHFSDAVKATFESSEAAAAESKPLGVTQDEMSGARKPKSKFIGLDPGLVSVVDAEEDDGLGWVNADNMGAAIAGGGWAAADKEQAALTEEEVAAAEAAKLVNQRVGVGCITTDFAMQNVLLQMGLQLMSADGMKVRRLKQWALKCEACFYVVHDMDRIFCPKCGTDGLKRVSVSVDRMGRTKVHTRKPTKYNTKGQIYSIPKSVGGRFDGGLLLREDQMLSGIWQQKCKAKAKALESFGGLDVLDKVGITVNQRKDLQVGFGKKNPNNRRGRERRGKKKTSETSGWW